MSARGMDRLYICSFARLPGLLLTVLLLVSPWGGARQVRATDGTELDARQLVAKMEAAYAGLEDYRTRLVITGFGKDVSFWTLQKLRYTFKKPDRVRVDFEYPHEGMSIVYPDSDGEVAIRPGGHFSFFTMHVDKDSPLVEISPGQHINQTDLGLLIRNIAHSVTDMFLGDLSITQNRARVTVRVLSDNPFQKGTPTRYTFTIDAQTWLPVAVEESTPEGVLKRRVLYQDMKTNTGVKDSVFELR